ncbi:hypothetical protein [Fredinandcohnia onubensis]|uniref:hypothetical protein n=1 Tax=Fredinandcohnia onubensis TaxID=1571209 RepID=UPI00211E8D39|nr:hypothetical protein [Fredinandcohnia onubensis]
MAQIDIKVNSVRSSNSRLKGITSDLTDTQSRISSLRHAIDSQITSRQGIGANLSSMASSINEIEKRLNQLHNFVDNSVTQYEQADKQVNSQSQKLTEPPKKSFWESVGDFFGVVGDSIKGFGTGLWDVVVSTVEGIWNIITHPVETFKGLVHVIQHPVETAKGIWDAIKTSWNEDVINGDAESRGNWFGRAFGEIALAVVGTKGVDKAVKLTKGAKAVDEVGGVRIVDEIVNHKTSDSIKTVLNENDYTPDTFVKLLDPDRQLTTTEMNAVKSIRDQIGIPPSGTTMAKVIPQSDIYNYLYNDYKGVRGFTAVEEHSSNLKTLEDNYEGARLDYNNSAFKLTHGVDGISQSTGAPDKFFGIIEYRLDDPKQLSIPDWAPKPDSYPYTGRGFTGSKEVVLPEYYQEARSFVDGDILKIVDANNGTTTTQFIYDADVGNWIPLK